MSRRPVAHALEFALFRFFSGSLKILPEGVALWLGGVAGWMAGVVLRLRRRDVDLNLALAFPEQTGRWRRRVGRTCYVHLGREAATLFRLSSLDAKAVVDRTEMVGFEALQQAVEEGRGLVLVTGHLGNWEIGGASFAARGLPIDVVAKGMANRRFERDLNRTRESLGMRVIDMTVAHREVPRSLREGRVVALVADQNARDQGVFVPFFGRLASTFKGPALFALRAGAPLFVGVCIRTPGSARNYRVTLQRVEIEPTGAVGTDVLELTRAHVGALQAAVASHPEQYFWQHKRWKTRPPEEPVHTPRL